MLVRLDGDTLVPCYLPGGIILENHFWRFDIATIAALCGCESLVSLAGFFLFLSFLLFGCVHP
jgi:hypothetical protein